MTELATLLHQAADQVDDPQEKTRLRAFADHAGSISRTVLGGVLTTLATNIVT